MKVTFWSKGMLFEVEGFYYDDRDEFDIEGITCEGVVLTEDEMIACSGDSSWYDDLRNAAATYTEELEDRLPGEDMDGDAESALASCGHGTDEDYGDYGGED